jgi:hypothetical protein
MDSSVAPFRGTAEAITAAQEPGTLLVEMESAAAYAFAAAREIIHAGPKAS